MRKIPRLILEFIFSLKNPRKVLSGIFFHCYRNIMMIRFYLLFTAQILRSISIARLWNLLKVCFSYSIGLINKQGKIWGRPISISIEPTNICNLHCPECPTGKGQSTVAKGKITEETVQKLVPQIQTNTWFANVYFQGEPLVNAITTNIVSTLSEAKILSSLSTNAHFLTSKIAKQLVTAKLTKLIISLDGYNQTSYEKYRQGGNFDKVLEGLKNIQQAKANAHSLYPLVEVQCLLFSHTEGHKTEIKHIAEQYNADLVTFKTAQFYDTQNIDMLPSHKNSRYNYQDENLTIKKKIRNHCWKMWCSCVVAWNGNVLPCCFDKNHTFSFGNIENTSFTNIWKSQQYIRFRKATLTNRKQIIMCQNCTS